MHRPTLTPLRSSAKRFSSTHVLDGALPKRPLKKIELSKARPAIYHKFNCLTENSDGSVSIRRSQLPKDEHRLIQDMRNTPMWNPHRSDLEVVDANAGGRLEKFNKRFAQFTVQEEQSQEKEAKAAKETVEKEETVQEEEVKEADNLMLDDYLELLGQNVQDVQKGGKLAVKVKGKKK